RLAIDEGASDIHLSAGSPPVLRLRGHLVKLDTAPLSADDTDVLARAITSDMNMQQVKEHGSVDFAFSYRDTDRCRANVYRQKGSIGVALRLIPKRLMTLEEIGLPPVVRTLLTLPRGLILVTGPTGSGK